MTKLTAGSPFLKPEDIVGDTEITFIDSGRRVPKEETGFDEDSFEITVQLPSGAQRAWTVNKTSQRMIMSQISDDPDKWVGKKVSLKVVNQNVRGKERNVIYVRAKESEPAPSSLPQGQTQQGPGPLQPGFLRPPV